MLPLVLLGWKRDEVPRLVADTFKSLEAEPSPLLEAIRAYLERAAR
ncbi:MAG: hypothetical protein Q8L48_35540 [Archangium sp.]|nr:hypothetical protein [Archangium sp.]